MCENGSLKAENLDQKQVKKSKKKFLKYRVLSMHLRSTHIFLAYLGPRKKKNHKRSKRRMLGLNCSNKEKFDKHAISSDVGPSPPGKAHVFPSVSSCSESKAIKTGYRPGANIKSNDESLIENDAEGEFRKRIDQNCSVLATATQIENISGCSVANEFEARQAYSLQDGKRDQMHNSLMRMLTRGLEETVGKSLLTFCFWIFWQNTVPHPCGFILDLGCARCACTVIYDYIFYMAN